MQTILAHPVAFIPTPVEAAPRAQPADSRMMVLSPPAARMATPVTTATTSPAVATMKMTDVSAVRMSQISNLKVLQPVSDAQGLPPAVTDKGGKGPSSDVFPLFTSLRAAPDAQLSAGDLTTISSDLYRDSNPASGIFYYLPARYVLYWDADNGYGLRMLYGTSAQPGSSASVTISARLTAAIDAAEVQLLSNLLHAALKDNFKELRPFPFSGSPAFSLKDDLRQFNVPAEKISIAAISDIAGDVDLSITTDTVTKENIETTLTQGLGLTGTATFTSAAASGAQGFSRTIPVQVRITDPRSFGTRRWRRDETARNNTPFPLKLKYLNFLTVGADGTPTVYSYDLQNTQIPPLAQVRIASSPVAGWLDGSALKMWISFGVQENYPDGVAMAKQQWTMGVDSLSTAALSFTSLTPFADPGGIARILIDVRSKYFDSQARSAEIKTAALTRDNDTAQVGPVFLINRSGDQISRPGDPLFAYRLSLVKSDGTVMGPGDWSDGDRLETFIGSVQLRPFLGGTPPSH
jgi:hypothetical protein